MSRRRILPALLLAVPLFVYLVYPLGAMLAESLTLPVSAYRAKTMGWSIDKQPFGAALIAVFYDPNTRAATWGTLKLALLTVLFGGAWGLALVLLWWRREFPGRRYFAMLGYAPIVMPPLVGTLAFFRLIGEPGVLWKFFPSSDGRPWLSNFGQVLVLHTYSFGVYTYAYVSAALEGADLSREEAARSLGAGRVKTFVVAVWPLLRAPIIASALLTYMAAAASFSAPYILDNTSRYLTVEIVGNDYDVGVQRALSVVLAALALIALPPFLYLNRQGRLGTDVALGIKGSARQQLPEASATGKVVRLIMSIVAALILLAPPLTVIGNALGLKTEMDWGTDLSALLRSTIYGAVSAGIDVALAVAIALALRRASFFAALPVEFAVMLALALPGSVVGISLLSAFNAPSRLAFGAALGGTATILVLAYTIRNIPLAVRPIRAALDAVGGDLENAAASLGADHTRTLWKITLPLMLPSLLAAALICFITGAGEFVASRLLYSVATRPVSVRIDEIFRTDPGAAYVLALCLMLLSVVAIVASALLQKRATK